MRKTYCYLGTKIKRDGTTIGMCNIAKRMQKIAKQTSSFGKAYPVRSLRLLLSIGGGIHNFYDKRFDGMDKLPTMIKTTLNLPRGLDRNTARMAASIIMDKPEVSKDGYAQSILTLLRYDGVKLDDNRRIKIKWKPELTDQEKVE